MSGVNWTEEELAGLVIAQRKKRSKFNVDYSEPGKAARTVGGITFASKREAFHYRALKSAEQAGTICDLRLQPRYELQSAFVTTDGEKVRKIQYVADFSYHVGAQEFVVDVKGCETAVFKLKAKLFKFTHQQVRFEVWK